MAHEIRSMMPAVVWQICVKPGDSFAVGDTVMILESMKMEIPVEAEVSGTVKEIPVQEGEAIEEDGVLLTYV